MATEKTKLFYIREFLNKPGWESIGLVLASVEFRTYEEKNGKRTKELSSDFTLGDCSRQITLDFCMYGNDKEKLANLRHKSAVLRKAVNDYLDAVDLGLDEFGV